MSREKLNRILSVLTILASMGLMTACGQTNEEEIPPPSVSQPVPAPAPGVPAPAPVPACVPLAVGQPIPFEGSGVYVDSAGIMAGNIPSRGSFGVVNLAPVAQPGPVTGSSQEGTIAMNVILTPGGTANPYNAGGYWPQSQTTANVTGVVTITNQAVLQDIQYQFGAGGYNPYNQNAPVQQMCITGIAVNSGFTMNTGINNGEHLFGTYVYLYLNNSMQPYIMYL